MLHLGPQAKNQKLILSSRRPSWSSYASGTAPTDTMLEQTIRRTLLRPSRQPLAACLRCQWRTFHATYPRLAGPSPQLSKTPKPVDEKKAVAAPASGQAQTTPQESEPLAGAPRSYGKRVDDFKPRTLGRPIGLPNPPKAGENTGVDTRTAKQKRDDFVDFQKHMRRREELYDPIPTLFSFFSLPPRPPLPANSPGRFSSNN